MRLSLEWTPFKARLTASAMPYIYMDISNTYYIYASDGPFEFECIIPKDGGSDQTDFDAHYKAAAFSTVSQFDTDGAHIVRNKAAKKGWTFCSLPIEFETSKLSDCLYSKDSTGADRSFITLKAYDGNNTEVTSPGVLGANLATIESTVIDFEPPYDFEIIGGDLRTLTSVSSDIRLWIVAVPDIAAPTGSKEMGGGINLKYLAPGNVWSVDGRVTKYAPYNAMFHTNKIRMIFKYPAGTTESFQIIVQLYKP